MEESERFGPDIQAINVPERKEATEASVPNLNSDDQATTPTQWRQRILKPLDDQWFLITMGIVIALASQVQVPRTQQQIKSTIVSYLMVSIIFLVTGLTLSTQTLINNYSRWRTHLFVQLQCFLLCSAIMFGIVSATATNKSFMDPSLLIGLIFTSCVPTTMSSNVVMTGQAGGNQELTVVQTTVGNFLGVFVSPALVKMYTSVPTWYNESLPQGDGGEFTGIYRRVLMRLGLSIYVPLVVGQVVRYFFIDACTKVFRKWYMRKLGSACMLVIIWSTYDTAFASEAFDTVPSSNLIFLVFILLATFLMYLAVSFSASVLLFDRKDVVAIVYCVTGKGPAVGVPLATAFFQGLSLETESKIQVPIVVYQGLTIAGGSILIVVFRKWIERCK